MNKESAGKTTIKDLRIKTGVLELLPSFILALLEQIEECCEIKKPTEYYQLALDQIKESWKRQSGLEKNEKLKKANKPGLENERFEALEKELQDPD